MTKSELIAKLAEQNPDLYHRDIEQLVTTVLTRFQMRWPLATGRVARLRGFFRAPSQGPQGSQPAPR